MWADVDTRLDFLNYSEVADLVAGMVRDPSMRPISVGVFGTWGTGKSTLLNLIEKELDSNELDEFIVVRFDAWLYQGFDDSRAALMEVIASTLIQASKKDEGLLDKAKSLLRRVNKIRTLGLLVEGGALAMGVPTFGVAMRGIEAVGDVVRGEADKDDVDAIKAAGKDAKERGTGLLNPKEVRTPPKEIDAFRAEFAEILEGLKKTLVVFVDNLDRCLPKQTIQTLEALRLFLFMGQTAFIVAADEEMIRHSVSEHFKDPDGRHVTDYLDKLIQVPVRVPRLGVQEVRAYLFLLFASAGGKVSKEQIEILRSGLESNLRSSWRDDPIGTDAAIALLGQGALAAIADAFRIADRLAPLLATSSLVGGNPRIVKRMLNVVRMRAKVAGLRGMPVDEALIAKMALFERCTDSSAIEHMYTEINASAGGKPLVLSELEGLLEDPGRFKEACPEPWATKAEFLREWLAVEPPLSGKDLRPLVYLSRETMPLRALRGELSSVAADALAVLKRATSSSSPSGRAAAASVPSTEATSVMAVLLDDFRSHPDWRAKPAGFDGALLLADASTDAAKALGDYLRVAIPKPAPWATVLLKGKDWFKAKEAR